MNDRNENMKRSSFLLYIDKREIVETLTDEQAGKVFKAIYKYVDSKEEVELDPVSNIVFVMFKQTLDKDEERYIGIVERNRNNGLKGGRPKKDKNPKKPVGNLENPNKPKKANTNNNTNINNNNKYFSNEKLNDVFLDFLEVRKKLRAVNSERAINNLIKKLSNYDDDTKYQMIENSITNSWKDVYELKTDKGFYQNKQTRKEIVPDWFDKEIKAEPMSPEEQAEMEELFKPFKDESWLKEAEELKKELKEKY